MYSNPAPIDLRDGRESQGEIRVSYQPIVDLGSRQVVGVAAVGETPEAMRVLGLACRQGARWAAQGLQLEMSVRLTLAELAHPRLVDGVRRALEGSGLEPSQLLLGIAETSLSFEDSAQAALHGLIELGVQLALEDFGTGYSSLVHLKRYPIAALKVDSTFVAGLGANEDDGAIVASVASLARALGSRCIAQGVQTQAQHDQLRALRCQAQGELFAAPVPAEQLPKAIDHAEAVMADGTAADPGARVRRAAPALPWADADRMRQLHSEGASLETIAAALNQAGSSHPKGHRWHARSVAGYLSEALAQGQGQTITRR